MKKLGIGTNHKLILGGEWENLKFSNIHKASNKSIIIFLKSKMFSQAYLLIFMQFTEEISLVSIGGSKIRYRIWLNEKTPTTEIDVGIALLL